jgi:threonine aldolase
VCLENTHNRCGGTVQTPKYTIALAGLAHREGLKVHLDGARIFNAAAALGVTARELAEPVDSVTFCLSKGLCAPVGSVLCGDRGFVKKAHRARKMLGGGMRQAGVLAAAGIVALETMVSRLGEDHARARRLARGLNTVKGIQLDTGEPPTNMVFFRLEDEVSVSENELITELKQMAIRVSATGTRRFRLVTHYWIDDDGIDRTVEAFGTILRKAGWGPGIASI